MHPGYFTEAKMVGLYCYGNLGGYITQMKHILLFGYTSTFVPLHSKLHSRQPYQRENLLHWHN